MSKKVDKIIKKWEEGKIPTDKLPDAIAKTKDNYVGYSISGSDKDD